ncbi:hypothetical protein, partial [Enterocloster bolteae]
IEPIGTVTSYLDEINFLTVPAYHVYLSFSNYLNDNMPIRIFFSAGLVNFLLFVFSELVWLTNNQDDGFPLT